VSLFMMAGPRFLSVGTMMNLALWISKQAAGKPTVSFTASFLAHHHDTPHHP